MGLTLMFLVDKPGNYDTTTTSAKEWAIGTDESPVVWCVREQPGIDQCCMLC